MASLSDLGAMGKAERARNLCDGQPLSSAPSSTVKLFSRFRSHIELAAVFPKAEAEGLEAISSEQTTDERMAWEWTDDHVTLQPSIQKFDFDVSDHRG